MTIEMKLLGIWILMWIALVVHHFMIRDMMRCDLKKLEDKMNKIKITEIPHKIDVKEENKENIGMDSDPWFRTLYKQIQEAKEKQ